MNGRIDLLNKAWNRERLLVVYSIVSEDIATYTRYVSKKKEMKWKRNNTEKFKLYQKKAHLKHKKILRDLKINGCAICGYNDCDAALDFHHVNPEDKKFLLKANNMCKNSINLIDEINKCILLCANCHREIHSTELKNNE